MKSNLPGTYLKILDGLKEKIRSAQVRAALTVNTQLLHLYWEIGSIISEQEKVEGWGAKIIERLSKDLQSEFPDMKGLALRNLRYMREFNNAYPQFPIWQQAVAKLENTDNQQDIILQQVVAKLPWGHNLVLLDKIKTTEERIFYAQKTIENGWSRNVLLHQIETELYKRQGKAITNFDLTLPAPQSDLAKEAIKNPYILDFLGIGEEAQERELERAIIAHLKKFLLELGKGFAYVGNQYNLKVEGDDYFLDLLFYNYHLKCFVVFELKVGEFKPEYVGKLNFYINTVDEKVKLDEHKPTIGILLCKTPNKTVVEYSLRGLDKPLGVSNYKLSKALPEKFKSDLPTVEELERELEREVVDLQKPIDKKLDHLKELIKGLKMPKVKEKRSLKTSEIIFTKVVLPIRNDVKKALAEIIKEFEGSEIMIWTGNQGHKTDKEARAHLNKYKEFDEFRIEIRLRGFKPAGTKAFDIWKEICITTNNYNYTIGFGRHQPQTIVLEKLYHQLPDKKEFDGVLEKCVEAILDDTSQQIERIQKEIKK